MSETLMNTAIRADGDRRPGTVGVPLDGVSVRLVDDAGDELDVSDDETVGEIQVRGPNLFLEYLNRPDATAEAMRDGWFATGDVATRAEDGYIRIVGRRATDLIKSGGYKIGAGEIENALNEHPAVAESAVTGEPDDDLGERIVAWVVVEEGVDAARRARARRPRGRGCSRRTSARAKSATWTRSRATPWARSPRRRWAHEPVKQPRPRADHPGEMQGSGPS